MDRTLLATFLAVPDDAARRWWEAFQQAEARLFVDIVPLERRLAGLQLGGRGGGGRGGGGGGGGGRTGQAKNAAGGRKRPPAVSMSLGPALTHAGLNPAQKAVVHSAFAKAELCMRHQVIFGGSPTLLCDRSGCEYAHTTPKAGVAAWAEAKKNFSGAAAEWTTIEQARGVAWPVG